LEYQQKNAYKDGGIKKLSHIKKGFTNFMFNITGNFQPLTDEQLTEVTGGGLVSGVVSGVPVAGPLLGPTVAGVGTSTAKILTDTNSTLTSTTTAATTGLGTVVTDTL
jgi:hypothetical protein